MLKWKVFAKKISYYFFGNQVTQKTEEGPNLGFKENCKSFFKNVFGKNPNDAIASSNPVVNLTARVRILLLNNFYSSDSETRERQKNIYAKEGDAAYQRAIVMNEALQGPFSGLYSLFKTARFNALATNSLALDKIAETKLASLVNIILKSYPMSSKYKFSNEILRQQLQRYLTARVDFELNPANQGVVYPVPYVSPDTVYAVMTAGSGIAAKPVEMPRFRNTIGFSILNPFYWSSMLLNGVSKLCFEYPARVICSGINKLFGTKKNSVIAKGLKTLLAGPFLLLRTASFAVAKLLSPGGLKETWNLMRRKQQATVADVSQLELGIVPPKIVVSPPAHRPGHLRIRSCPDSKGIFSVNSLDREPNSAVSIQISLGGKKHSPRGGVLNTTPSLFSRAADNPETEEQKCGVPSTWYDSQANIDIFRDVFSPSGSHSANVSSPRGHKRNPSSSVFFNSLYPSPPLRAVDAKGESSPMNSFIIHVKPKRPAAMILPPSVTPAI